MEKQGETIGAALSLRAVGWHCYAGLSGCGEDGKSLFFLPGATVAEAALLWLPVVSPDMDQTYHLSTDVLNYRGVSSLIAKSEFAFPYLHG